MSSIAGNPRTAGSSRVPLLFMAGVFLFLAALFTGIGGSLLLTERSYRQEGVRTEALVTGKALRPAGADTGTVYLIAYRFSPAGGSPREQTSPATVHQWERVERGSSLAIEYRRGQPDSARLIPESAEETVVASIMAGVGVLLGLIGLGLLAAAFRRRTPSSVAAEPVGADVAGGFAPVNPPSIGGRVAARSAWQIARASFGFWFGGIFLICGLPFFLVGLYLFYDDWRFAQEARSTQGMVLTKDIRISSGSGNNRSRTRHYEATYRFAAGAATYEGKDELSHAEWQRLREREPVEVLYRPQRPASNHLAGRSEWLLKTIFALIGSIFAGIGGALFVRAIGGARTEARLRRDGIATHGTVLARWARNVVINNVPQWRLQFEYRDRYGQRHEGTADMPIDVAETWQAGEQGRVLYDPARPARSVWLGRDG